MAEDDTSSGPKASWHEREVTQALQRLASARANLATLEEQDGADTDRPEPDPADIARATELQAEVTKLIGKSSGRFGGSSARAKLEVAQTELRLVLERLGVERLEDLGTATPAAVDPTVLDFARRECANAEKMFLEVAAMVMPDAEPEPVEPDGEVIVAADSFGDGDDELDLRIEPSAAS